MPFIKVIDEGNAEGKLKDVYEEIIKSRGKLSNIMKIHSLNLDAMIKHMELYKTIMFGKSNLSREVKEMIAVVVSVANKCDYCINHHAEALNFYWKNKEKLNQFIIDFRSVEFEPKVKLLLEYAYELTITPKNISLATISSLRSSGWNDEDILLANLIISYFNFVNRIALGLGVEFSEDEIKGYKY
ncbi:MAG: peroxidase-related enzyme [Melioribacter sp.]|uniref:peroxidase-related enzyme n=1 Tax=Rosettibacter primus TaxID=3111523 RepID=UPI00247C7D1E|nr:peroxidase-related enzyme [Melioribacter sp.]